MDYKIPPHNIEAEMSVLGGILIDNEAANVVIEMLQPTDFYRSSHGKLYEAMMEMSKQNQPIDFVTLTDTLKLKGILDEVGGVSYIATLIDTTPSVVSIKNYAKIVKEKALKRDIIAKSIELQSLAYEDGDIREILDTAQKGIMALSLANDTPIKSMREVVRDTYKIIEAAANSPKHTIGTPGGFRDMDRMLSGFRGGKLYFIAGRPAMGKTSLSKCLAQTIAKTAPVLICSLEMPKEELAITHLSGIAEIDSWKFESGIMSDSGWSKLTQAAGELSELPIFINDAGFQTDMSIMANARRIKAEHGLGMLIVDYLQLVRASIKAYSRDEAVGSISRNLKALSMELDIPIVCLSQLNRDCEKRPDKRPMLSDLRESGCLCGETLIQIPNTKRIVKIKDMLDQTDFDILTATNGNGQVVKAKKCFSTGVREVFKLTLTNGQSITATSNHRFLTPEGWSHLRDLKDKKIAIPISYQNSSEDLFDEDEVALVGHFLANGSALKGQPIRYTCNIEDKDLVLSVTQSAIRATKDRVVPYSVDTITTNSKFTTLFFKPTFHLTRGKTSPVADIMRKYRLFDVRSKEKFIPEEMFFMGYPNTYTLLRAMFSGDGCASYREAKGRKILSITYSSSSKILIYGVQSLLAKVGIVSYIRQSTNGKQSWYSLSIQGKSNISRFVENIGFLNKRKQDKMNNGWEKTKGTLAGWTKSEFNPNRTLCFFPIASIAPAGHSEVYDIEVPNHHNFTANSMVVHNSIEQDADVVMFCFREHVYNKEKDPQDAEVIVAKHRGGKTGTVYLNWKGEYTNFYNRE